MFLEKEKKKKKKKKKKRRIDNFLYNKPFSLCTFLANLYI